MAIFSGTQGADTLTGGTGDDLLCGDTSSLPGQTAMAAGGGLAISLSGASWQGGTATSVFGYVGPQPPAQARVNAVYVVDVSGSMAGPLTGSGSETLLDGAIAQITAINAGLVAAGLGHDASVALVAFNGSGAITFTGTPASDAEGNGTPDVIEALRYLRAGGLSYYEQGLATALTALRAMPSGEGHVLFASSGAPNGGSYAEAVEALLASGARIHPVSLGNDATLALLDGGTANETMAAPADIARIDIAVNGIVVASIPAAQLASTPFGLRFDAALGGLSPAADDVITATLVSTGGSTQVATITLPQTPPLAGGNDIIHGGGGNDRIDGGAGHDRLHGDSGNDVLAGGAGNDAMDGGAGIDTTDYASEFSGVRINLIAGRASGPGSGQDTLTNIERATGGHGDDVLIAGTAGSPSAADLVKTGAMAIGSLATALSLGNRFDLQACAAIADAAVIPHATIIASGSGDVDTYAVTATAGSRLLLDIDGANFDTVVQLLDASGSIVASNDDGGSLDPGTTSSSDSRLGWTVPASGTWYIRVRAYSGGAIAAGQGYTLHISLENAPLTSLRAGYDLAGGGGNDLLVSGRLDDRLNGDGGIDTASFASAAAPVHASLAAGSVGGSVGGSASGDGADQLTGIENLTGSAHADTLVGDGGANLLNGMGGADWLDGGGGDDTYVVDSSGDILVERAGEGIDTVRASVSHGLAAHVENLTLTAGALAGTGNALANRISGNVADNLLSGAEGSDTLSGGAGADTLAGDGGHDRLYGDAGADSLLGGAGDDLLSGGASADTDVLAGGTGNDTLDGASGHGEFDLLSGNAGADLYLVDSRDDEVIERAGEGVDTVIAHISGGGFYLDGEVEHLVLAGATAFGVGNALGNRLTGNAGANMLAGGDGNDTLIGRAGDDLLIGGTGADVFIFASGCGSDAIDDFQPGLDRISLRGCGFASFADIAAHCIADGDGTAVVLDSGDRIALHHVPPAALSAADFIL